MFNYIDQTLADNEKVEGLIDYHWITLLKPVLLLLLLSSSYLASVILWKFDSIVLLVAIIATGYFAGWPILLNKSTEMGITNKRIILKQGFFSVNTEEMRISSIETVEVRQSMWERMLGVGSVKITGKGVSDLTLFHIKNPIGIKRNIENVLPTPQESED